MTLFEIVLDKPLAAWTPADYWKMRGAAWLLGMLLWFVLAAVVYALSPWMGVFGIILPLSFFWGLGLLFLIGIATRPLTLP